MILQNIALITALSEPLSVSTDSAMTWVDYTSKQMDRLAALGQSLRERLTASPSSIIDWVVIMGLDMTQHTLWVSGMAFCLKNY